MATNIANLVLFINPQCTLCEGYSSHWCVSLCVCVSLSCMKQASAQSGYSSVNWTQSTELFGLELGLELAA